MSQLDLQTSDMYTAVARHFGNTIQEIFDTEETLKAAYASHFSALPFDRTDRWNTIAHRLLKESWDAAGPVVKSSTTLFDENQILIRLAWFLDYNLFTQVLLNLQPATLLNYRGKVAEETTESLKVKWAGKSPSPFDAKPKMFKTAATEDEQAYNRDLSTLKALRIVSSLTFARSFRVSPKCSTPALTDSENLSMLGIGGDQYLTPPEGFKAYYFTWAQTPFILQEVGDKIFTAPLIPYKFESKSGGDILNAALFSRYIATRVYSNLDVETHKAVLPRMNSVLLVTNAEPDTVLAIHHDFETTYGDLIQLHYDQRSDKIPEAA